MADNGNNVGTVEQVTGVVIDVVFPDHIPEIFHALKIEIQPEGGRTEGELTLEVQQHLGDDRIRAIAMDATDGIRRGDKVTDTGGPITVPVGKETLGRIFNLLGETIDEGPEVQGDERWPIHRRAPEVEDLAPSQEILFCRHERSERLNDSLPTKSFQRTCRRSRSALSHPPPTLPSEGWWRIPGSNR